MVRINQEGFEFEDSDNENQFSLERTASNNFELTHIPSGETWTFNTTGDLSTSSVSADSVTTQSLFTERDIDSIVYKDDGTIYADSSTGRITEGSDASTVIQAAIDEMTNIGGGRILCSGPENYDLTSQVVVKQDVVLDCSQSCYFFNNLSDDYKHPIIYKPKSSTNYVNLNANGKQGVKFGEGSGACNSHNGIVDVFAAGNSIKDTADVYKAQSCVTITGFNLSFGHVGTFQGRRGVDIQGGSDIYIDSMLTVNNDVGLHFSGGEHILMENVDLDSSTDTGLVMNSCNDIHVNGTIWFNDSAYDASPSEAAKVGQFGKCREIKLDCTVIGAAPTGVKLFKLADSSIDLQVTNANVFTDIIPIDTAIEYNSGVENSVDVTARVGDDITTAVSGTINGTYNGIGTETANAETPTTADWNRGDTVMFTDSGDGSGSGLYLLLLDETWTKIGSL